jgi:hypothetical protein
MDMDRRGFITLVGAIALSPKDAIAVAANPPASVVLTATAAQVNINLPPAWIQVSGCYACITGQCPHQGSYSRVTSGIIDFPSTIGWRPT